MFAGAEHSKKLNMKVAGTLNNQPKIDEGLDILKEESKGTEGSKMMDDLTKQQKKNLKKKLARKRKKL